MASRELSVRGRKGTRFGRKKKNLSWRKAKGRAAKIKQLDGGEQRREGLSGAVPSLYSETCRPRTKGWPIRGGALACHSGVEPGAATANHTARQLLSNSPAQMHFTLAQAPVSSAALTDCYSCGTCVVSCAAVDAGSRGYRAPSVVHVQDNSNKVCAGQGPAETELIN